MRVDLRGLLLPLVAVSRGRIPNFSGLVMGVGGRDTLAVNGCNLYIWFTGTVGTTVIVLLGFSPHFQPDPLHAVLLQKLPFKDTLMQTNYDMNCFVFRRTRIDCNKIILMIFPCLHALSLLRHIKYWCIRTRKIPQQFLIETIKSKEKESRGSVLKLWYMWWAVFWININWIRIRPKIWIRIQAVS